MCLKKWSLVCSFIFIFAAMAFSQEFTVGVEDIDYYPHYKNAAGNYSGYAKDVLDAFAKEKGYTFQYKALPVKRLFSEFLIGKVDFKYPDNSYWAQDLKKGHDVKYSSAVVEYIDGVVLLPKKKGLGIEKIKTLGTVMGFTAWDYLDKIKAGEITNKENPNYQGLLNQVIKGRVDGAYCNIAVTNYQLNDVLKQSGALVFDADLPHTKSYYSLSTIKHVKVIEEFNKFLIEKKDIVDKIKEKYKVEEGI